MMHRLQPALLDRLTDPEPSSPPGAGEPRFIGKAEMRAAVLRDLSWLLNTVQVLGDEAEGGPLVADSVLGYGLPAMTGAVASRVDVGQLERAIRQAILRFEPRVLPKGLQVKALETDRVLDAHNVIELEIRGLFWAQPAPQDLLLRARIDLEAGRVTLRDVGGVLPSRSP
jgi:type VI secretion system protein ImpF